MYIRDMDNPNLNTALTDLVDAIRGITLGSIEPHVIRGAGESLINHWNDHINDDNDWIDVGDELKNWDKLICEMC
jgi:hypothetical protein